MLIGILLILFIGAQSAATDINRNTVELVMLKLNVSPSRQLCYTLGKHQCKDKKGCCQDSKNYVKIRQFSQNPVSIVGEQSKTEKQLCMLTNRTFCGNTCCMKGECEMPSTPVANIKQEDVKCQNQQPSNEDLCKGAGLLWCDGSCCGFDSTKHQCFMKNHYGIPFIRCPIEAASK